MEDDTSSTSNVIKGPWKRVKVVSPEETDRLTEDMNFIDEVAESIMIPTIHNLSENGVDIKDKKFISEIGFLNEIIKSIMCRSMGYKHAVSILISKIMDVQTIGTTQSFTARFDHDAVDELVKKMLEENDKT
tara:strand:- start:2128 stop:2523 length:396 start_codon:yes stop_codon:yes gene_type:complete